MARNNIISAFVELLQAEGVGELFDPNSDVSMQMCEEHRDLDDEEHRDLHDCLAKRCSLDVVEYLKELRVAPISIFTVQMVTFLETMFRSVLRTQTYTALPSPTEWLRTKIEMCIDAVFLSSSGLLYHMDEMLKRTSIGRKIQSDYKEMYKRHKKENELWGERKRLYHENSRKAEKQKEMLKQACRKNLSELGGAIFFSAEGRFTQYVHTRYTE
jgi:hypothetical protein